MSARARSISKGIFAATVVGALGLGLTALSSDAQAFPFPGPITPCPFIYAPVVCDDGNVYTNQCFADSAGATGCIPYPLFP